MKWRASAKQLKTSLKVTIGKNGASFHIGYELLGTNNMDLPRSSKICSLTSAMLLIANMSSLLTVPRHNQTKIDCENCNE